MKNLVLHALGAVFLYGLFIGSPAYAGEVCLTDTSDWDGDGWGWENNMSCHVGPYNPPTFPLCETDASDPDRDGWGWENGQTCKTDDLVVPGNDIESAGLVELDKEFGYSIDDDAVHYYKFEVTEGTGVLPVVDAGLIWDYEYSIVTEDGGHLWDGFLFLEEGVCLTEGAYYFMIGRYGLEVGEPDSYTATLASADLNCVEPSQIVDTGSGDWWITDDGFFYQSKVSALGERVLSRMDPDGTVHWEVAMPDSIASVESVDSGGVLVITYNDVQFLDDSGNSVWAFDTLFGPSLDYEVSGSVFVLNDDSEYTVYSLNLGDGSVRWRYDYSSNDYMEIARAADDGKVTLKLGNDILIFD